jgi:hypothetical protein
VKVLSHPIQCCPMQHEDCQRLCFVTSDRTKGTMFP